MKTVVAIIFIILSYIGCKSVCQTLSKEYKDKSFKYKKKKKVRYRLFSSFLYVASIIPIFNLMILVLISVYWFIEFTIEIFYTHIFKDIFKNFRKIKDEISEAKRFLKEYSSENKEKKTIQERRIEKINMITKPWYKIW